MGPSRHPDERRVADSFKAAEVARAAEDVRAILGGEKSNVTLE
jgi:hypothetical protein